MADSFAASSQSPTLAEKASRADVWTRLLFGVVPEERLQDAFDRAFRQAKSNFPVNAYDLKLAWEQIEKEEQAEREKLAREEAARPENRVRNCKNRSSHVSSEGEIYQVSPVNFNEEIKLPCPACRPKAYEDVRARFIRENIQIAPPLALVADYAEEKKLIPPDVPDFPLSEAEELRDRYNTLVCEITTDDAARNQMCVIWDEGGQVFTHRNGSIKLYTPGELRKLCEKYEAIVAPEENGKGE